MSSTRVDFLPFGGKCFRKKLSLQDFNILPRWDSVSCIFFPVRIFRTRPSDEQGGWGWLSTLTMVWCVSSVFLYMIIVQFLYAWSSFNTTLSSNKNGHTPEIRSDRRFCKSCESNKCPVVGLMNEGFARGNNAVEMSNFVVLANWKEGISFSKHILRWLTC